jgi:hypothetical protein
MANKKNMLGQFFTTEYEYILQGMSIPMDITTIIDPFCGDLDLLKFINKKERYTIKCYDIDPRHDIVIEQDTIKNPPNFKDSFILTNPPYLARNKSNNKELFDLYKENDLYKCFLRTLINDKPIGGIIIIPVNFWSSIRKNDILLRKDFLNIFSVVLLNIFEKQVFADTSYSVCSFQFVLKNNTESIKTLIYPSKQEIYLDFNSDNNYTVGGDIYKLPQSKYSISRLTRENSDSTFATNILLKCIDNNINNRIRLEYNEDRYVDTTENLSERSYATLIIEPVITIEQQKHLIQVFNVFLDDYRTKYNSLFLSNYREGSRKRISFKLAYTILSFLLNS